MQVNLCKYLQIRNKKQGFLIQKKAERLWSELIQSSSSQVIFVVFVAVLVVFQLWKRSLTKPHARTQSLVLVRTHSDTHTCRHKVMHTPTRTHRERERERKKTAFTSCHKLNCCLTINLDQGFFSSTQKKISPKKVSLFSTFFCLGAVYQQK